jgi:GDP-L-fucose synthase
MTNFWQNKKVLVTGGDGFIGSHLCELLIKKKAKVSVTTLTKKLHHLNHIKNKIKLIPADLTNLQKTNKALQNQDIVMHLAAKVAGIEFNKDHPASMFGDNVVISKNILEASAQNKVERILITSSACVYPRHCQIPTPETEGFKGDPEPTNIGYGWAKRVSELMAKFYAQEYDLKIAIARPYNGYGPRDNFNPQTSHVIPALIKRVFDGENPLTVWGSGKQTRSFLYVVDFARGLMELTEKYPIPDPVNIGAEEETTISNLAKLITKLSGKNIKIKFDTSKPDGQPRRKCDTRKAKKLINFKPHYSLEEGLKRTINWYKNNYL